MKKSRWVLAAVSFLIVSGLVAAAAEMLGAWCDQAMKLPVYAGGAAGIILGAAGLPFARKLSSLQRGENVSFWRWWGAGILTRMLLAMVFAAVLANRYKEQMAAALFSMSAVYLTGMFGETAYLATVFFESDKKITGRS